jgi:hypothetical protein
VFEPARVADNLIFRTSRRRTAMGCESGRAFESIESAHEFVTLLAEAVAEAKAEVATDVDREKPSASRRLQALQVTLYTLEKLELHIRTGGRILNDLRSLRRLLYQERAAAPLAIQPKPMKPEVHPVEVVGRPSPKMNRPVVPARPAAAA